MKHNLLTKCALALALAFAMLLSACAATQPNQSPAVTEPPAPTEAPAAFETLTPTEAPEPEDTSITVTDMTGREIKLDAPATKVVALTAGDCEILYALGAGDALVGRGAYCDWPLEVYDVPSVESGYETNIEQIIALEPQVLFMATMNQPKEQVEQLEAAGVKVVVSDADDIEGTYTAIELIGSVMGKDGEAAALIASMKTAFSDIAALAASGDMAGKTVYFEVSPLQYGLWTAGNNTFMNEAAELVGLRNCFDDVDGWAEISQEQVIERNPDYIMTISMYFGEGPTPEEEILSRSGWENITAVKNNAILNLANNELSRPAPRLVDGVKALYDFVYPAEAMQPAA